jgi:glutamate synthase domain-containing protein 1
MFPTFARTDIYFASGMMVGMPHEYYRSIANEQFSYHLGLPGSYASGIVFVQKSVQASFAVKDLFADHLKHAGLRLIGWKTVETGKSRVP